MTAATRTQEITQGFDTLNDEVAAIIEGCSNQEWQAISVGEAWTIAAVAHHIAIVQQGFVGMVERFAAGETFTPKISWDKINEENARHAQEYAQADRQECLDILASSRSTMRRLIEGFDDGDLDRVAGNFGGNELTIGQVLEYVVVGHVREHLGSINATLQSSASEGGSPA